MTATRILLALAALTVGATSAQANTTGSIQLKGTVQAVCSIAVTETSSQQLNITGGENNKQVGEVVETCNSGAGYTVTVTSANAGQLKNGNSTISYSLRYDTQNGTLNSPMSVQRSQPERDKRSTVAVTIPATAAAVAGTYADTITISIAAR